MKLIADSGSTKTSWALLSSNGIVQWSSVGLNPVFHSNESFTQVVREGCAPHLGGKVPYEVHFYGAGCGAGERKELAVDALKEVFPKSRVNVEHDMLGAARACFGNGSGICGILGTGSNCCVYTNGMITENPVSLGYILGDHGSGNQLGKKLIAARLENRMPTHLSQGFDKMFPDASHENVIRKVYWEPLPNRYLASFAPFASAHLQDEWVRTQVAACFDDFFVHQAGLCSMAQPGMEFRAVGSIAAAFEEILQDNAEKNGFAWGGALQAPITALMDYHTKS